MNNLIAWFTENIQLPPSPYPLLLSASLGLLITSEANSFQPGSALFKILASLSFLTAGINLLDDSRHGDRLAGASLGSLATVIGLQFSFLGDIFLIPSPLAYYNIAPATVTTSGTGAGDKNNPTPEVGNGSGENHGASGVRFKLGIFFFAAAHILYIASCLSNSSGRRLDNSSFLETFTNAEHFHFTYFALSFTFCLLVADFLGVLRNPQPGNELCALTIPNDLQPLVKVYIGIIATMVSVATATDSGWQRTVGAWLFMISDLFVAVDTFGSKTPASDSSWGRPGWELRSVGWVLYFWAQMIFAGTV